MESKNEKFTGNSGHGRPARREKKEKKKVISVQLETDMKKKQELKTVQSLKKEFFCVCVSVVLEEWGRQSLEVRQRGEQSYLGWCFCR